EVILDGALIGAGHLLLAEGALGFALGFGDRLDVIHLALALDAHSFQGDARHRTAGTNLAFHLRGPERIGKLALAAITDTARLLVRPFNSRIVPAIRHLSEIEPAVVIRPAPDAAPRSAPFA